MIDFKRIENICAIVMVVAFFLPWVSGGGMFSFAGYQLPNAAEMLTNLSAAFSESGQGDTYYSVYLVYLVPLLAIGVLATDYLKSDEKVAHYAAIAAGVFPVVGFLIGLINTGSLQGLAIGVWLTMLAAIVMLLATFGVIKRPE
tara:strand:- start:10807 stop:11238 length:432 start_codon:yes stop_codon:yes gene_type:complete